LGWKDLKISENIMSAVRKYADILGLSG